MASPLSPRVHHGMLVRLTASQASPWGLEFPLNPESLHRTLVASEIGRPQEVIAFTLRLDATDALADRDALTTQLGIHPQLAVLERLLHRPTDGGVTLFAWGSRAVPVLVTELAVNETMFDPALNPIRADVEVSLRVLAEEPKDKRAVELFRAHERWHEDMASQAPVPHHGPSSLDG